MTWNFSQSFLRLSFLIYDISIVISTCCFSCDLWEQTPPRHTHTCALIPNLLSQRCRCPLKQVTAQRERIQGLSLAFDFLKQNKQKTPHASRLLPELMKQPIVKALTFILWSYITIPEVDTLTIFVFLLKGKLINTELSWFLSQFSIKRVMASFGENAESEPGIHGNYLCFFLSCLTEYQLLVLLHKLDFRLQW